MWIITMQYQHVFMCTFNLCLHAVKSDIAISGISNLEELDTLTLLCTATPPATILWIKRSNDGIKIITPSSRISLSTQQVRASNGQLITNSSLVIEEVEETDGDEYVCEAENGPDSIPTAGNIQVTINGILTKVKRRPVTYIHTYLVRNECRIDPRGNSPCQNEGMCIDLVREYRCICIGNYQGVNCQEEGTEIGLIFHVENMLLYALSTNE